MDVPSLLLALPLEVWDRILFWMSLLPIDVANFAKASTRCHFLAFGPVGDRNEHNVSQHQVLGYLKWPRTPNEILMRILRLNNQPAAWREFDQYYARSFYEQVVSCAVPVSRRLMIRAIRWLGKERLDNFRILDGLKAFCHLPLDTEGRFASRTETLEGAAAGNNAKVVSTLLAVWQRLPTITLIASIRIAAQSHSHEAFALLMGAHAKSGSTITIPLKVLWEFLTTVDFLTLELVESFLLYLVTSSERSYIKAKILRRILCRLSSQKRETLERVLLMIKDASELRALFWDAVAQTGDRKAQKAIYGCAIQLGFVFSYDVFRRAIDFANHYCSKLMFGLIFRAELVMGEKWKAVWCASEIRSGAGRDPDNLPRLLDGLLEGGGSDFDLAVFGEVMNRLYGGQGREDPDSARPILDAFRPYLYPEEEPSAGASSE